MSIGFALLACIGLTFILKYGSIISFPRNLLRRLSFFDALFECSLCLGFWAGVIVSCAIYFIDWNPSFLFLPLASAALGWSSDSILRVIQTLEIALDQYLSKK